MRAALTALLLVSTALLAGCVEGGYAESGVRYDSDGGYYGGRGFVRESRSDIYLVPDRDRYQRYDRYQRDSRYDRYDRGDRNRNDRDRNDRDRNDRDRNDRDRNDRDRNDRDNNDRNDRRVGTVDTRRALDAVNGQRDRRDLRNGVCEYPCVR